MKLTWQGSDDGHAWIDDSDPHGVYRSVRQVLVIEDGIMIVTEGTLRYHLRWGGSAIGAVVEICWLLRTAVPENGKLIVSYGQKDAEIRKEWQPTEVFQAVMEIVK